MNNFHEIPPPPPKHTQSKKTTRNALRQKWRKKPPLKQEIVKTVRKLFWFCFSVPPRLNLKGVRINIWHYPGNFNSCFGTYSIFCCLRRFLCKISFIAYYGIRFIV